MKDREKFEDLSEDVGAPAPVPVSMYVEDALIILSVLGLLVCLYFRNRTEAQVGLWIILALMLVVLARRVRRVRQAFRN